VTEAPNWWIYRGTSEPNDGIGRLPAPPPWRVFDDAAPPVAPVIPQTSTEERKGVTYRPDLATVELVNAALYLRRPLLVTGRPGTGKSTLADAVAYELKLGRVLRWTITSRVNLRDGLYQYDPLARLYAASRRDSQDTGEDDEDVGRYVRLGPLGTALLPGARPRVLLIDEIDKSDLDLPNDLLTVFEDGEYEIPELVRQAQRFATAHVTTHDSAEPVPIHKGHVRCREFPFVVMTSNGEREFPAAFLRRCIQVELPRPDDRKLTAIVDAHLGDLAETSGDLIRQFLASRDRGELATDQLLNAIYLTDQAARAGAVDRDRLADKVMIHLSRRSDDG
jgi:MoxR-like ATPase